MKTSWLVRDPWFVTRHAMPAARRAQQELESLRRDAAATGFNGFLGVIDLSRAQMFAATGDTQRAREAVAEVRAFLAAAGVQPLTSASLEAIETELGRSRPGPVIIGID